MFPETHSITHLHVNDSMTLAGTGVSEMYFWMYSDVLLQLCGWVDFWDGADAG